MTNQVPSLPKGTRDFYGETLQKRYYIIHIIKQVFELYGFSPLETPTMENTQTLMGKYGEEGDKLIFRVLNNGDLQETIKKNFESKDFLTHISEKALRYDLTIPFARFVANHYAQITLPFKRYQIQPVWRGDRPQKGRYREFYQCDADMVGSHSFLNEVELLQIYRDVFTTLKIPLVSIHLNSRKILLALIEKMNAKTFEQNILTAIDKIDKIGIPSILQELASILNKEQIDSLNQFLNFNESNDTILNQLALFFANNKIGTEGVEELKKIDSFLKYEDSFVDIKIDPTLARGLNYYTGVIFEVKTQAVKMGSIGGGGRYDNLTTSMGVPNVPGIGISFGIDRIYDVMQELNIFPTNILKSSTFLFFNMGDKEIKMCFLLAQKLRKINISCEIFYEKVKLEKQFRYAEKKEIPYIIIIGETELMSQHAKCKNLQTGKEVMIPFVDIEKIQSYCV